MQTTYTVPAGVTARLDIWLVDQMAITRAQVQKLIKADLILVNDVLPKKNGDMVSEGDVVTVLTATSRVAEKKKNEPVFFHAIEILSETPEYIVINKPAGLIVHPAASLTDVAIIRETNTLSGWLLQNYPELAKVGEYANRPGMVHRLDKDTSGLMVVARTQKSFKSLKEQFKNRSVVKKYYALAHGELPTEHGFLNFLVARGKDGRMVARPNITEVTLKNVDSIQDGRVALTEFEVMQEYINYTLCNVTLHTGRTHQIRVHFFAYNHPLVGDPLYFNKKLHRELDLALGRVFLHSYHLEFQNIKGEQMIFDIPLPEKLKKVLSQLKSV
jgi:23S rRNA pseudouridine1911/1915/1917 synthase